MENTACTGHEAPRNAMEYNTNFFIVFHASLSVELCKYVLKREERDNI